MGSLFSKFFQKSKTNAESVATPIQPLDYDKLIILDAEDLAEEGFAEAYRKLLPELTKYIAHPAELTEVFDSAIPSYRIRCDGEDYLVFSAEEPGSECESWGRATYFFFLAVNKQLVDTGVLLYAINSGNELGALFLTPEEATTAQSVLPRKTDWPYIPTLSDSWYGQFH